MKTPLIILVLAVFFTGIMAGIFFTWSNAVKPGIGKLTDMGYLESLQAMNQVILNPLFYILFFGAVVLIPLATGLNLQVQSVLKIMVLACAVYIIGVFLTTLLGNIPLNNMLEAKDLDQLDAAGAKNLRLAIEKKWNTFNMIRTVSSCASFALLLVALIKVTK